MSELLEHYIETDGEIILELSLSNLKNNVRKNFGDAREVRSTKSQISNYEIIPSIGDKTLLIKMNITGEHGVYQVLIRFINAQFGDGTQNGFVPVVGVDGITYHVKQFTSAQKQVRVRCNCLDFYYRFSVWNYTKKSLEGDPPPPYVKKTDLPPVNPNKVAGACKHIIKAMAFLRRENIIK